jgi:G3E family GTPase
VGCTLAGSLTNMIKDINRKVNPDYLFVEPFELVVTREILTALAMGQRDIGYEVGPVFSLIDAFGFDFAWGERKQTLLNHIELSHRIFITRTDLVNKETLELIRKTIKKATGREDVLPLSIFKNEGIEQVMDEIT